MKTVKLSQTLSVLVEKLLNAAAKCLKSIPASQKPPFQVYILEQKNKETGEVTSFASPEVVKLYVEKGNQVIEAIEAEIGYTLDTREDTVLETEHGKEVILRHKFDVLTQSFTTIPVIFHKVKPDFNF